MCDKNIWPLLSRTSPLAEKRDGAGSNVGKFSRMRAGVACKEGKGGLNVRLRSTEDTKLGRTAP